MWTRTISDKLALAAVLREDVRLAGLAATARLECWPRKSYAHGSPLGFDRRWSPAPCVGWR
jgi:hypothetical protein